MKTAILTSPGGRLTNQDAAQVLEKDHLTACILADGLGGLGGGEFAAQTAVATALKEISSLDSVVPALLKANDAILAQQQSDPAHSQMRTTAVMLVADQQQAVWAHAGDSRLYLFRDGRLTHQTLDHSVPQSMVDAGRIKAADIRGHADRNRLLKSLGSAGVQPELADAIALKNGDAFLLASDGFWELVHENEMEAELAKAANPQAWLDGMAGRLRARAPEDHDNYTAIAAWIEV